jgi:hypothetical protein
MPGRASPATHGGQTLRAARQRIRMGLARRPSSTTRSVGWVGGRPVAAGAAWPHRTDQPADVLVNWSRGARARGARSRHAGFPDSSPRGSVSDMLPIEQDATSGQAAVTKRLLAPLGARPTCHGL